MTKVLIVDDSPTMRKIIKTTLNPLKVITREAGNGLEAIEQLALDSVDVMLLDLNMPDMHGFEVIRYVRQHDDYRDLPIVVISTRADKTSRETALQSGANEYLTKPFTPEKLTEVVRRLLQERFQQN